MEKEPKMKQYTLSITDCGEPELVYWRGNNTEHAKERFVDRMMESGGMEGIEILKVTLVKN